VIGVRIGVLVGGGTSGGRRHPMSGAVSWQRGIGNVMAE